MVELNLKGVVFQGLNGETINFSEITTIQDLKNKIASNYIAVCRKCGFSGNCKFYYESKDDTCRLIATCLSNYIDMNIKSIDIGNRNKTIEFIKSCISLSRLFEDFINWIGIYSDKYFNWYFESMHPSLNSAYSHNALQHLSYFLKSCRWVDTNRVKRFIILVEGDSEYYSLPSIFSALGIIGVNSNIKNSVKFINLKGKGSLQENRIKDNLNRFREAEIDYFLILDKDASSYIDKLGNLVENEHILLWDNNFEDEFPIEKIVEKVIEIRPDLKDKMT